METPQGRRTFEFQKGPIFTQICLADEINRATPKTQSAMLETMQEKQVTVAGTRYHLEPPFFVMATQNPIEQEGTYPLPEAQLDRFFFKLIVGYSSREQLAGGGMMKMLVFALVGMVVMVGGQIGTLIVAKSMMPDLIYPEWMMAPAAPCLAAWAYL